MSSLFGISGSLNVQSNEKVKKIVNSMRYGELSVWIEEEADNKLLVCLYGVGRVSPETVENHLNQLSEYAISPSILEVDYNGEKGFWYFGPAELKHKTLSEHALGQIMCWINRLTDEDKKKLNQCL